MKITHHRLDDTEFVEAKYWDRDRELIPDLIVLHDTASRLNHGAVVKYFRDMPDDRKVSAHFVVERDGTVTQQVPTNRVAWHADPSRWKGKIGCNRRAIGIEIVNPGELERIGKTKQAKAWFGTVWSLDDVVYSKAETHGNRPSYWLDYTPEQINAVTELCRALIEAYPTIEAITTHWEIAPGRKVDTNPLFPLERVRQLVFAKPLITSFELPAMETSKTVIPAADPPKDEVPVVKAEAEGPGFLSRVFSDRNFSILNQMSDLGSRTASQLRTIKNTLWSLLFGSCAVASAAPPKTTSTFMDLVAAHPFWFVGICSIIVAVALYLSVKLIEKHLVAAFKKGLHKPSGSA